MPWSSSDGYECWGRVIDNFQVNKDLISHENENNKKAPHIMFRAGRTPTFAEKDNGLHVYLRTHKQCSQCWFYPSITKTVSFNIAGFHDGPAVAAEPMVCRTQRCWSMWHGWPHATAGIPFTTCSSGGGNGDNWSTSERSLLLVLSRSTISIRIKQARF
jgi:hypothetical protein